MTTTRTRGSGRVWQRKNGGWTIGYYVNGVEQRESVAVALNKPPADVTEREARALLTDRLAVIGRGAAVTASMSRLTVGEVLDDWLAWLEEQGCASLRPSRCRVANLKAVLGYLRVPHLTPKIVREKYFTARREDGVTDGTIHGELLSLTAALNRARKEGRLVAVPYIPKPPAPPARQGYPEPEEFEAIVRAVDGEVFKDALIYADATGRRSGEVVGLTWEQVFLRDNEIRYADTKNGDPLTIPIVGRVAEVLTRRAKARRLDCLHVFHEAGRPFNQQKLLRRLQRAAPTQTVHNLRRSGVRNLVRGGATETVAMSISGHRSRGVFTRYNITSIEDQIAALRGMEAYRATRVAK